MYKGPFHVTACPKFIILFDLIVKKLALVEDPIC
jgi:hypothetical protein